MKTTSKGALRSAVPHSEFLIRQQELQRRIKLTEAQLQEAKEENKRRGRYPREKAAKVNALDAELKLLQSGVLPEEARAPPKVSEAAALELPAPPLLFKAGWLILSSRQLAGLDSQPLQLSLSTMLRHQQQQQLLLLLLPLLLLLLPLLLLPLLPVVVVVFADVASVQR
ncbi:hypothetical protein JKP88DRAFT_354328 [Tribonema minus]|uniref:Uncharacterized protein n=1 Tax=Tribonema minus TaxID=303371 RepID=A0A836CGN3_9STRA|nr:hypothetical protein JKP88DRAFT_354328 [Tribonema minus]